MISIYANNSYKDFFKHYCKCQYKESDSNIKINIVPKGMIINERGHGFGVFDQNFKFVKSSLQCHKGRKGQFIPIFDHSDVEYHDEDAIYLSHMGKNSFGHFLIEYLSRGWILLNKKYTKMKVVLVNEINVKNIPEYIYELLGLLGVERKNVLVLNKNMQFKNVYVPDICFDLECFYSDVAERMYDKIAQNVPHIKESYKRLYVSRCKMPEDRRTWGEEDVQKIFEKNGYKIIYPEKLPLKTQIALVKQCKCLAGCGGTALHLALFMKHGGTVIQIKRNKMNSDNAYAQYLINKTKHLNSIFVAGSIEDVKTDHYSYLPQIIAVTPYMKQFFDDNNFKYSSKDIEIDKIIYERYKSLLATKQIQTPFIKIVKKRIIQYISMFVPGRERRAFFRIWLGKLLNYK